jgi:catechol 2,3-dioxygenase-like lactoylglutathione lyase family enzyme
VITGLDHVLVAAPPGCEPQAREFYGHLLGLVEVSKPIALARRGGVWFQVGHSELHVGIDSEFAPARKAHPALAVDGGETLERLAEQLGAAGFELRWDGSVPGSRRFFVDDPFGNRLELVARG